MQHCLFFSVFQWVVEVTLCSSISVVRWRDQIGDRDAHGAVVFVVTNHAFYLIYMSINSQKSCMLAAPNYPLCVLLCVFSWSSAIFCLQLWAPVSWRQQYQSSRFEERNKLCRFRGVSRSKCTSCSPFSRSFGTQCTPGTGGGPFLDFFDTVHKSIL